MDETNKTVDPETTKPAPPAQSAEPTETQPTGEGQQPESTAAPVAVEAPAPTPMELINKGDYLGAITAAFASMAAPTQRVLATAAVGLASNNKYTPVMLASMRNNIPVIARTPTTAAQTATLIASMLYAWSISAVKTRAKGVPSAPLSSDQAATTAIINVMTTTINSAMAIVRGSLGLDASAVNEIVEASKRASAEQLVKDRLIVEQAEEAARAAAAANTPDGTTAKPAEAAE